MAEFDRMTRVVVDPYQTPREDGNKEYVAFGLTTDGRQFVVSGVVTPALIDAGLLDRIAEDMLRGVLPTLDDRGA
jgi:hypothetical protein